MKHSGINKSQWGTIMFLDPVEFPCMKKNSSIFVKIWIWNDMKGNKG